MDASEFQITRKKQLSDFQTQYSGLKSEYSTAVINALKEQDRSKQCVLIQQVMNINKKITAFLKSFTTNVDPGLCKANPELMTKLKSDIWLYNNEHEEIQHGTDQLSGLRSVIERTKEKTKEITDIFSWYAVLIFMSVLVLVFIIVFRSTSNAFNTQPSTSIFSGSH